MCIKVMFEFYNRLFQSICATLVKLIAEKVTYLYFSLQIFHFNNLQFKKNFNNYRNNHDFNKNTKLMTYSIIFQFSNYFYEFVT
mgnify:CR=1 FL=1